MFNCDDVNRSLAGFEKLTVLKKGLIQLVENFIY